jgi:hypothetical protein
MRSRRPAAAVVLCAGRGLGGQGSARASTLGADAPEGEVNLAFTGHMTFLAVQGCAGLRVTADLVNESDVALGPFKVGFLVDFAHAAQLRVKELGPGELLVVEFIYRHPVANDTSADVWADFDDRIVESDEEDNYDGDTLFSICS